MEGKIFFYFSYACERYVQLLLQHLLTHFIRRILKFRRIATFAEARKQIMEGLEGSSLPSTWKFLVPRLGPVSSMQERKLVMLEVLCPTTSVAQLGHGSAQNPLEVIIQDVSNSP